MENTKDSIFLTIPHEVLVDLLYLLPTSSVINFYSVSSAHLKLFDAENGLWAKLTRKIFKWSNSALPSRNPESNDIINWKKEYRVASYFDSSIKDCQIRPVATNTDLSLLQTISKNHFKTENTVPIPAATGYCTLQSDTKLFPLPIGNFTTAYYEVEAVSLDDNPDHDLVIGGAIKGYSGYVGTGIASYGYWNGAICLEYALTPVVDDEFKIALGDIVGFGINFANKSVFFTKNGNLIHEANKNFDDQPLLELLNLHASISMGNHEVKVNMGSAPFEFDLLKYQRQHAQRPLELYSNVVVKHLLSAVELTKQGLHEMSPFSIDNNLPDFEFYLPEVLYVMLFGRLPPNSKYFKNDENTNQMLIQMTMLRVALNSAKIILNMKSNPSPVAKQLIEDMIQGYQMENINSKPWEEQVMAVLSCAEQTYSEILLHYMSECVDEIAECAFARVRSIYRDCHQILIDLGQSQVDYWAKYLLATLEFVRNDRPGGMDHWTKECAMTLLNLNNAPLDEMLNDVIAYIVMSKNMLAAVSVLAQRCRHLVNVKTEEKELMMTVFGKDNEELENGYINLIDSLIESGDLDPFLYAHEKDDDRNRVDIQIEARLVIENDENADPLPVVLYGIYYLKISPNDFESLEDYVREVFEQNKKLITDDMKQKHLLDMKMVLDMGLGDDDDDEDIHIRSMILVLKAIYNVQVQMTDDNAKDNAARLKKEIERMLETKNYGPARRKTITTSDVTTTSLLIAGTVAAIGVIGLGAWWIRKRLTK